MKVGCETKHYLKFSAFISNNRNTERDRRQEITLVQMVPSLNLKHSHSSSRYRGSCPYSEVKGMGRRERNAEWGRHGGTLKTGFSYQPTLPASICELIIRAARTNEAMDKSKYLICLRNHLGTSTLRDALECTSEIAWLLVR